MFENTLSSIDSSSITKNDRVEFDRVPALTVSEFLTQLPNLTDRVLQQEYLDRVEATELMMSAIASIDDEDRAIRIVELTWEINKKYAARLAGAAHPHIQQQTVARLKELINRSVIGLHLQIELLAETASESIVPDLLDFLQTSCFHTHSISGEASNTLRKISVRQDRKIVIVIVNFILDKLQQFKIDRRPDPIAIHLLGELRDERAVPFLLSELEYRDSHIRIQTIGALEKIGSLQAVETLSAMLESSDIDRDYLSRYVVRALGRLGDERVVKQLIQILKQSSSIGCWDAAEALAIIGTEEAIDAVIGLLEGKISQINRMSAQTGESIYNNPESWRSERRLQNQQSYAYRGNIDRLSKEKYERLIEVLSEALSSRELSLREHAGSILVGIGDDRAIEPLIQLLKTGEGDTRAKSAEILGKIGNIRAIESLIDALDDRGFRVRYHAVSALGKIGDCRAIEPLIEVLKKQDYYIFRAAVFALAKINGTQAVEGLNMSLQYSHPNFRKIIAKGLGMTGDDRAIDALKILLQDPTIPVRIGAASALGEIACDRVIEPLALALQDRCGQVREVAFKSISKFSNERVRSLLFMCFHSKFGNLRYLAMRLNPEMNIKTAIDELTKVLQNGKRRTRIDATNILCGIIKQASELDIVKIAMLSLITASQDRHSSVRECATRRLGDIPTIHFTDEILDLAINALTATMKDRAIYVRFSSLQSLDTTLVKLDKRVTKKQIESITNVLNVAVEDKYSMVSDRAKKLLNRLTSNN